MPLSKTKKRIVILLSVVVVIIIGVILSLNLIIASVIRAKLNAELEKNKTGYTITLGGVGGNIFFGNIRLKDIIIKPDTSLVQALVDGKAGSGIGIDAEIPLIRLTGFGIARALLDQEIRIGKLQIRRAKVKLLKGRPSEKPEMDTAVKPASMRADSIHLDNVSGFSLRIIDLTDIDLEVIDLIKDEKVFENIFSELRLTGIAVEKYPGDSDLYYLATESLKLEIFDEEMILPGGDYELKFDDFSIRMVDSTLVIDNLELKPTDDRFTIAAKYKFTREIFDLSVEQISVHSINIARLVHEGDIFIDSLNIRGMMMDILKDKLRPFDESKRPKLINQALREMDIPLYIGKVNILESYLIYQEREEGATELMTVTLGDLNVEADFITSVRDSTRTGKPMKLGLNARLMETALLQAEFVMPLNSRVDTFFFVGSLGPAKLSVFNTATLPATGAKFNRGELHSLTFKGRGNRTQSIGEMTMLYDNLEGEVMQKDQKTTNRFLSWAANAVMRSSNPGNNGKVRVALVGFDRVMYKGFGNFMWKSLQTGIVNTISPTGKLVKKEVPEADEKKEDANSNDRKQRRRRNRQ